MIEKYSKGSDLFFQIKTFLRNYPFRPPLFPLTPLFPLPRCALGPPFAHAPLLFPSRCALGPPFAHAPLLFPPPCALGPPFAHAPLLFLPSVCNTALPCTRKGRSENIAKNLKDSFYNWILHYYYWISKHVFLSKSRCSFWNTYPSWLHSSEVFPILLPEPPAKWV